VARVQVKDYWLEQRQFERRALVAAALIGALILLLIGRLFLLQIVRHDYYTDLSQGNRVRIEPLPAARGLILDRSGAVLAENSPAYQLELVREEVPNLEDTLQRLVALQLIAPEDLDETRRQILSRRTFDSVPVRLHLEEEEIARFAVHRFEFPGVDINTRLARSYPNGDLAVHALGYVGAISESDLQRIDRGAYAGTSLIGKLGVEAAYEKALHGTNGSREVLVNAQGRSVQKQGAFTPRLRTVSPAPGSDLLLSIDLATQRMAEESLGEHRGAVVAIDPGNGDVLALVSKPGFDPALFARGITRAEYARLSESIDKPLFNRALRGTYPSGSTIKPVISLAALTDHAVDPDRQIFCTGEFHLPGSVHLFREGKGGKHGHIALREAIAKSCDVYFFGLAATLGVDRISSFMAPFGYGELTGIDISGEKPGILPSQEWKRHAFKRPQDQVWFPGETVNLGIGQGYLLVTPLQLAHVASVLAGHGKSFQPRLVTGIRDAAGHVALLAPKENKSVDGISDADWDIVYKGMIGATVYGTAALPFKGVKYAAAGKTGTAQVFSVAQNEKYNEKNVNERLRDHAWFIAFAPVEAPRIAVAVLVENGGFGASSAAPIARKVMDTYLLGKTDVKPEAVPAADEGVD
jgi:penicillin-binding protein 2